MTELMTIDWNILYWIQGHIRSGIMDKCMPVITHLGSAGAVWILIALCCLFFRRYRLLGVMLAVGMLCELALGNGILKHLIARSRPCWLDPSVTLLIATPKDFSFPSGHTFVSFTCAVIIFLYKKSWGIPALILAGLIAFSRLYLFVHFPSDILGGLILGIFLGMCVFSVFKRKERPLNKWLHIGDVTDTAG